jgi:hypothetical protein
MQYLEATHEGSTTPVVEVLPLMVTVEDIKARIEKYEQQLLNTPEKETGIRHSLKWVIKYLQVELFYITNGFKAATIEILTKACEIMNLTFDGPGTTGNFRKCPGRNAWKVYLRAKEHGNVYLQEAWLKGRIANKMVFLLQDLGFVTVRVEGGCADLGCSIEVGF